MTYRHARLRSLREWQKMHCTCFIAKIAHWRTEHIIRPLFSDRKPVDHFRCTGIYISISQYPSSMPLFR
ncbi:hypothetical protein DL886_05435 [Salmonella enterica subsp. enterica serovar Infantis]|uniref:Uncharacterized protein n=11 Tax=Salmonella enterica I TaxID=59201 RepID=A0A3T3G461_SALET|nr:hypothetical protein LFZ8_11140 [Salmonella enterica subsp. enterica serovar Djakarta str. S-1087]APY77427.1 hypothetical protein LFZ26_10425 [Salmonella enterica subsp. enterica serovar Manchester str. ST278]AVM15487.1 hypothetical protein C4M53_10950 [Salmonella enterica subsp. enterica]AVS16707.1 hypothetical protein C6649_11225 [Salmonella enterica]EAA0497004.1 hypothetical protein [Salmonella enterica subsp. enterica serovar Stanley]EAA0502196.1 hypothetical protein [Salmonella enteric